MEGAPKLVTMLRPCIRGHDHRTVVLGTGTSAWCRALGGPQSLPSKDCPKPIPEKEFRRWERTGLRLPGC